MPSFETINPIRFLLILLHDSIFKVPKLLNFFLFRPLTFYSWLLPWNEDLDFEARDLLTIDLAETFSKKIDLVSLRKVGIILQKEAIMKGKRLYANSSLEADRYEVMIMKSYQILSDERKDIISEAMQSGRFYHA